MKVTFLGGADEVGASCTLLEIAGKRILVDAGIRISPRTSRGIANDQLPDLQPISAAGGPDVILVTHAHTDHTGALPLVMEQYPYTPVIMTRPTEALVRVLQKDALNIMKSKNEQEGELPLFDEISVNRLLDAIQLVEFNQAVKLGEDLQVTYHVAGHIAGAAMLVFESGEGTFVMSGDVSMSDQRTVRSVQVPRLKADALVLESTYGGKLHANRVAEEKRLIETLSRVAERGGKVLIPAFALGRSQEIIQILHAYSDKLQVPVYVDGMVRTVCDAYARFADLLPQQAVRMAGDEHLFFRDHVKPVRTAQQREEIARSAEPVIVVASSGMLTGGASVVYARHFASDERCAIFLTGYQDEESPGRFLQRLMREREAGDTPALSLGKDKVTVRCEIDTYSLSAHADESELVRIAEAFGAEEVMLVHGEEGPRHSLATALRQRQRIVTTPRSGTERNFSFQKKPWAIGAQVKQGAHAGAVDLEALWASLRSQAGSFFSVRELALIWWGDGERAAEMRSRLEQADNVYLAPDWRDKNSFQVRSEEQVKRIRRQRAIMLAHPDLVGKLVVLRDSNNQPRVGLITSASIDSFEAIVANVKGSHYPADALVWAVGAWEGVAGVEGSTRLQLTALLKNARAWVDALLPIVVRKQFVAEDAVINPPVLLPNPLPEGIDRQTAITALVLALAKDGAVLVEGGLKPERARELEPMEQNEARDLAMSGFPAEARLRKVGMEVARKRLVLYFDFPQAAQRIYEDAIEDLIERSGWDVQVKPQVNQQALALALDELLPLEARVTRGPSYFMDKREVQVELEGLEPGVERDITSRFLDMTDFKLAISHRAALETTSSAGLVAAAFGEQLEINQAYAVIRHDLEPLGMYKCGLKGGQIILSFVSPQLGERYREQIAETSRKTGFALDVHPHPNQQKILEVARRVAQNAGWHITKGPSIFVDRGEVGMILAAQPDETAARGAAQEFEELTGYRLLLG